MNERLETDKNRFFPGGHILVYIGIGDFVRTRLWESPPHRYPARQRKFMVLFRCFDTKWTEIKGKQVDHMGCRVPFGAPPVRRERELLFLGKRCSYLAHFRGTLKYVTRLL